MYHTFVFVAEEDAEKFKAEVQVLIEIQSYLKLIIW
jgi:hypothetical protein